MILPLSSRASCAALTATATMCVQVQNEEKEEMVTQQIYDKIRYTLGIYVFKPYFVNTHSVRKKLF